MYPLVGLISTTSVLGIHPALTNTARMRELICCAPVISFLAARQIRAILCIREASKTDPTEKGQTVYPRTDGLSPTVAAHVRTNLTHTSGADVIIAAPLHQDG